MSACSKAHATTIELLCGVLGLDCTYCLQEAGLGLSASRSSSEAQSAYAALLEQAVSQVQLVGADAGVGSHNRKAHEAAEDRLYSLLEAIALVSTLCLLSARTVC